MRLASHLGQPLQVVKRQTTSSELLQWLIYLDDLEVQPPTRLEQYIARVAMEVHLLRLQNARNRKSVTLKDFFFKFVFKSSADKTPSAMTEEEIQAKKKKISEISKMSWLSQTGVPNE